MNRVDKYNRVYTVDVLTDAESANPHWYRAMAHAAKIMTERRKKYAGDEHPYFNFVDMAHRNQEDILKIFRNYINIKASRLSASINKDFEDESVLDTFIDLANYALIAAGWILDGLEMDSIMEKPDYA